MSYRGAKKRKDSDFMDDSGSASEEDCKPTKAKKATREVDEGSGSGSEKASENPVRKATREVDEESDSGCEEVRKKPAKKERGDDSSEETNGVELSKNRKVTVRKFKDATLIDIREFWTNKDGDLKPSKKGISLTLDQWKVLRDHVEDVDAMIEELD